MKPPRPPGGASVWWQRAIYAAVIAYFVLGVAAHWRADSGFTSLIRFGQPFASRRLPELRQLPVATAPASGYDGQFYAQLAVRPDVRSPDVQRALDNPEYRARRILLPLVAHTLGAGQPWLTLQIYALLNVAAWGAFAWLLHRETRDRGVSGTLVWGTCLLNLGTLDSVRESLTDLPATLLIASAIALLAGERNKTWLAAALLSAAGLVRETAVLAVTMLAPQSANDRRGWRDRLAPMALAVLPAAVWMRWLAHLSPGGNLSGAASNFDWPGRAFLRHFYECGAALLAGSRHEQFIFGPLAALGLAWQSVSIIRRAWHDPAPWARAALPFALMFWVLGDAEWGGRAGGGYWAVARVCLPMTVAYALLLPRGRRFWWWLALPNICVLHAVIRFWPDFVF